LSRFLMAEAEVWRRKAPRLTPNPFAV